MDDNTVLVLTPAGKLAVAAKFPKDRWGDKTPFMRAISCLVNEAIAARDLLKVDRVEGGGVALTPRGTASQIGLYGQRRDDTDTFLRQIGVSPERIRETNVNDNEPDAQFPD